MIIQEMTLPDFVINNGIRIVRERRSSFIFTCENEDDGMKIDNFIREILK